MIIPGVSDTNIPIINANIDSISFWLIFKSFAINDLKYVAHFNIRF